MNLPFFSIHKNHPLELNIAYYGKRLETLQEVAALARGREGEHPAPTERDASRAALFGLRQLETSEAVNNLGDILRTGLAAHVGEVRLDDIRPRIAAHEVLRKLLPTHTQTGDRLLTRGRTSRKSWLVGVDGSQRHRNVPE